MRFVDQPISLSALGEPSIAAAGPGNLEGVRLYGIVAR
jgi:hypothetical protein